MNKFRNYIRHTVKALTSQEVQYDLNYYVNVWALSLLESLKNMYWNNKIGLMNKTTLCYLNNYNIVLTATNADLDGTATLQRCEPKSINAPKSKGKETVKYCRVSYDSI